MKEIVKFTSIFGLALLILPLCTLLMEWHWQPENHTTGLHFIYYITETASYPWAGIVCLFLALFFVFLLKLPLSKAILLTMILASAVLGGQIVKSALKNSTSASRPYVEWLAKEHRIKESDFYKLERKERALLLEQKLANVPYVQHWLKRHWKNETGYSFPSGHALFVATWALIAVALLCGQRRYIIVTCFMIWAIAVFSSRLLLGMHWPEDLIVSTIIAYLIALTVAWWCIRYRIIKLSTGTPLPVINKK